MRAAQIQELTGPEALRVSEIDEPNPSSDQILIEVAAAGVAFPDLLLSRGLYQLKPPPPFVPGSEVAGTVVSAPDNSGFATGDRVAALTLLNGFAERAVAPLPAVYRLPDDVSFAEGAALPMNYLTVQFAFDRRAALREGEWVLVHGAAGGVGTAALQFVKWRGAHSIAVVSSEEKIAVAKAAGADEVVMADGFRDSVRDLTAGRGVDVVLDPVGGDRFTDSLRCLAPEGRLLVVGFTAGEIPTVKVNRLLLNNIAVVGVSWGTFALATPGYLVEQWQALAPGIAAGALRPPVAAEIPMSRGSDALHMLDQRQALGKIVLLPAN
jgi:NADPH2:quinone reductase